ncbi:hypothetical protein BSZ39_04165 [Bowdeniella nasicola]|uniref:Transport permease protein n=1 Tax=Bowdeniella nasicola TaxID=208480 RepID=A0A1Q5Q3Q5_9ACTO|nr:ABC transporter permease [Bowdeniella nasicola]OKL54427.1 hypothetical protein BSZ39_04165 [Bowdeniella nasicola]
MTDAVYQGQAHDPLTSAHRARRFGWWYFAEHYLRQMRRYGWPLLLSDIGQPLLYLIAMGIGLGALVDANAGTVEGVSYLVFVAPALLVSISVQSSATEMTYPVMAGFKWQRFYYAPAGGPLAPWQIALGHTIAVSFRFALQAVITTTLMWTFAYPLAATWPLLLVIGPLAGLAFGVPLQAYSATVKGEGTEFSTVQRFIVMPLFLFSGTFYPLAVMPSYLQGIGWISPIWHGAELARAAAYGKDIGATMIVVHAAFLLACIALGIALAARTYRKRLTS